MVSVVGLTTTPKLGVDNLSGRKEEKKKRVEKWATGNQVEEAEVAGPGFLMKPGPQVKESTGSTQLQVENTCTPANFQAAYWP